jgi:uncharacterized membrane protein
MRNKLTLTLTVLLVLGAALGAPHPVLAQDGGETGEALQVLENTFKNLGVLAIKFMYTLSFIVVVVGGVKNGFAINVAQQIGIANMASRHTWNFIMGIVVFVLFLATLPILNLVINNVTHLVPDQIEIFTPSWG